MTHRISLYRHTFRTIIFVIAVSAALASCQRSHSNAAFDEINAIACQNPDSAIALLSKIDRQALSQFDRHRFDLLTIKATDKAYITHTSDSLILSVIDYFSAFKTDSIYTEALYYGGRVYSDLGDLPTALTYFQKAAENLESDHHLYLKGNVMSQTGRLLHSLKLYDQAEEYIRESIRIDSLLSDSINIMYDHQQLGTIALHKKHYDDATQQFRLARRLAETYSPIDTALLDVYLSGVAFAKGDITAAIPLIQSGIRGIDKIDKPLALAYAAKIFKSANIPDSAWHYAHQLMQMNGPNNRHIGYEVALSKNIIHLIPKDSLTAYVAEYALVIQQHYDRHEASSEIMQNSYFNYQLHEKKRINAEHDKLITQRWMAIVIIAVILLITALLYQRNRTQRFALQLHEALRNVAYLKQTLNSGKMPDASKSIIKFGKKTVLHSDDIKGLKEQLKQELLTLQAQGDNRQSEIAPSLLNSRAFASLQECIACHKTIGDDNPLWNDIEQAVLQTSNTFKASFTILLGGDIDLQIYHMALLIKCGIQPTQLASLMGRTKSTITYRRESIGKKIFGHKLETRLVDELIRSL